VLLWSIPRPCEASTKRAGWCRWGRHYAADRKAAHLFGLIVSEVWRAVRHRNSVRSYPSSSPPAGWRSFRSCSRSSPTRIRVGYVLSEEGGYSYLLKDDFDALALSLADLHSFALDNLSALPSGRMTLAEPPGGAEGFIAADDNFAAARILLPKARKRLASKLGEEFLVTLPHRDWCFCWSLLQPQDQQAQHAAEALEDFLNEDYRLTPDILKATSDGFSLYRAQEPAETDAGTDRPRE